jgi:hypothetical protein
LEAHSSLQRQKLFSFGGLYRYRPLGSFERIRFTFLWQKQIPSKAYFENKDMKLTNKNLKKIDTSQDYSSSQLPDIKDPSFWTVFASASISVYPSRDSVFS